jgi:cobalt-zinc-cadmium efflux system protein
MHGGPHHHAHDHHAHDHQAHDHDHHPVPNDGKRYSIAIALNAVFVAAEAAAGFFANSTAVLADAGHNLSDVLGLALAGAAAWLATRAATDRRTYGFGKATVLAALLNGLVLVTATGAIAWEAVRRFGAPEATQPMIVIAIAAAGVVFNGASALLFLRGRKEDLNIRGAYLHLAADAAVSLGVVVSGLATWATGVLWIDPLVSLVIVVVILAGTYGLLRESIDLALDAAPRGVDVAAVRAHLAGLDGVAEVHDLHIWAMSSSEAALTAHLVRPAGASDMFLAVACGSLKSKFGIAHATLQVEQARQPCEDHHP